MTFPNLERRRKAQKNLRKYDISWNFLVEERSSFLHLEISNSYLSFIKERGKDDLSCPRRWRKDCIYYGQENFEKMIFTSFGNISKVINLLIFLKWNFLDILYYQWCFFPISVYKYDFTEVLKILNFSHKYNAIRLLLR